MTLNLDCVRDLLVLTEKDLNYNKKYIQTSKISIEGYDEQTIAYSAEKLVEAGYLIGTCCDVTGKSIPEVIIKSITFQGHELLDNIRDDGVWKRTKSTLSPIASVSLSMVSATASQVLSSIIKGTMGLM